MKTILYTSKFKKVQSAEYLASLDVEPDEIVEWDGDHYSLPEDYSISSLPCIVIDPEGEVEEQTIVDPVTSAETKIDVPLRIKKLEYRKNQHKVKAETDKIQAKVKAKQQ